jgi:hypothetical protein
MGYITYSLHYGHGEVWNETRPFWDFEEMARITSIEYTEMLAEKYGCEFVFVVSVYSHGSEIVYNGELRAV